MDPLYTATLSAGAYRTLATLVYDHSRIRLGPDKQPMLANRLRKRLRTLGLSSFDAYCALLESANGAEEIAQLVDLISTNHTKFFREHDHFTFLSKHILPDLVPQLLQARAPLRIWSAAASSGEEPYTLAIVLAEYFRGNAATDWEIDASDISQRMLAQAKEGIYPMTACQPVPADLLTRYFQKGVGVRAGTCRVKVEIRQRVRFWRINLFQPEYPLPRGHHVIFCRNVLMYFDPPSRAIVLDKLTHHLADGGYFIIGHSENLLGIRHDLKLIRQGIFRRS